MSALSLPSNPSLLASTGAPEPHSGQRLAHAAVEFESVLLGQWLGSAEKSFATVPGSEDEGDAGSDQMLGFAMQQMARSIAQAGGIGIGKLVQKGLEKAADASVASSTESRKISQSALTSKPPLPANTKVG